jgi:hypothetical protein
VACGAQLAKSVPATTPADIFSISRLEISPFFVNIFYSSVFQQDSKWFLKKRHYRLPLFAARTDRANDDLSSSFRFSGNLSLASGIMPEGRGLMDANTVELLIGCGKCWLLADRLRADTSFFYIFFEFFSILLLLFFWKSRRVAFFRLIAPPGEVWREANRLIFFMRPV